MTTEYTARKKNACLSHRFHDKSFIEKQRSKTPHPDKDKIIDYLMSGEVVGESSMFDEEAKKHVGTTIRTDGVWRWDDVLRSEVHLKNFQIGEPFLNHMKENNWEVPELDLDDQRTFDS